MNDDEIEELRKRIDRLEWLITIMRDRGGGLNSPPLYLRVQAQRVASLA